MKWGVCRFTFSVRATLLQRRGGLALSLVIPAKAGIQSSNRAKHLKAILCAAHFVFHWIPAFAEALLQQQSWSMTA
jgi:hypothetical protein